jgi:uncharacterized protein (TIGR02452 family)
MQPLPSSNVMLRASVPLNFSDDCFSGGNVQGGSGAQEESIFRRTNYHTTLQQAFYPLQDNEAVYSPAVTVLKSSENQGWHPVQHTNLAFIACPALKRPYCPDDRLTEESAASMKKKMELVLQIAYDHQHDTVVLGAWGSGVWCCPPEHMATLFLEVLQDFAGCFRLIIFAITSGNTSSYEHSRYSGSLEIYRRIMRSVNSA